MQPKIRGRLFYGGKRENFPIWVRHLAAMNTDIAAVPELVSICCSVKAQT